MTRSQPVIATAKEALRLLGAEDDRQTKLHEILETIREQIRLGVPPEHRPDGLFQNIQNAVYAMRGRTALLNDAAIVAPLAAAHDQCGVQNEQVQTLFTDLVGFIAGSRQHEIDLELRDQILNKVFAIRAALAASVAQQPSKAHDAALANLKEAWAALAMIREAVETLAPSGSVKAAEHLDGPTFMHEAEALVAGVMAISPSVSSTQRGGE